MNVELKKEAEYFGDIVIVPYMDSYDLVVVKTVAICEYGVSCQTLKLAFLLLLLPCCNFYLRRTPLLTGSHCRCKVHHEV